jgi:hypothetical protein
MKPNINCPQEMDYVNPATNTIEIKVYLETVVKAIEQTITVVSYQVT